MSLDCISESSKADVLILIRAVPDLKVIAIQGAIGPCLRFLLGEGRRLVFAPVRSYSSMLRS